MAKKKTQPEYTPFAVTIDWNSPERARQTEEPCYNIEGLQAMEAGNSYQSEAARALSNGFYNGSAPVVSEDEFMMSFYAWEPICHVVWTMTKYRLRRWFCRPGTRQPRKM